MKKKSLSIISGLAAAVLTAFASILLIEKMKYLLMILLISAFSIILFLKILERNETDVKKLVIICVMTSITVASRAIFEFIPHFKPVTAIVIITGLYLGREAGFICGAFSALISNLIFGQGPWTPFQMLAWGLCGFFAALFSKIILKNTVFLLSYGLLSGIFYSLLMDIYTVLWMEESFNISRYFAVILTSLPVTVIYCISNVTFLILFNKPFYKKIERIKTKYAIKM